MSDNRILIVEDDPDIRTPLASFLGGKGFSVTVAGSAEDAALALQKDVPDLLLLDIMLPGMDGLEFCRKLRATDGGPRIIMLTALSEPADKVIGLELGADDYVSKPFDLRELLARIRAVLRRPSADTGPEPKNDAEMVFRFREFEFHPYRRFIRSGDGLRIPLTGAETDLLLIFCQNAGKVLSREALINLTRGEGFAISTRSVDLLVSRLRRKLAGSEPLPEIIRTVRADGYVFETEVTAV